MNRDEVFMRRYLINTRKTLGYTQEQVAKEIGISQRAYSMIELNQINPSWEVAQRLEKFFGIPAGELLAVEPKQPASQ
ncbi:MAG: helix-turn-helix transcriptional regulator [Thermoanaerobacter sp.]|nr:helix-turn-helix transcriptional regulator [Thermoanaerobacter sp.]